MGQVIDIKVSGLGFKVVPKSSDFWLKVNRGKWEPYTFSTFRKFLKNDKSYVDIGCWIGPTVFYGCQLSKHCYAIEPDPVAFSILRENVNINSFSNISLYDLAIADKNGTMKIGAIGSFGNSKTSYISTSSTIEVSCLTLEEFFIRNNIIDCNFIKIDIEGGEFLVLSSSKDFLKTFKPTIQLGLHSLLFLDKKLYFDAIVTCLSSIYPSFFLLDGSKKKWNFLPQLTSWNNIIVSI